MTGLMEADSRPRGQEVLGRGPTPEAAARDALRQVDGILQKQEEFIRQLRHTLQSVL